MTSEELNTLITEFRKENEDLVTAMVRDIFNVLYGQANLEEGVISIYLSTAYISTDDYEVVVFSAVDTDGTDIKEALTITKSSVSGFTVLSPRAGILRWETIRRLPKLNFWTE